MSLLDDIGGTVGAVRDWALGSSEDVPFATMRKALEETGMAEPTTEKSRALFYDPYAVMDFGGWRQRPSAMTYETLRAMAMGVPIIAAIINLRVNQISQFCRPQQDEYSRGYRIVLRDRRDSKMGMSPEQAKLSRQIEQMIETTGLLLPGEKPSDRDSFRDFTRKAVRDVLTYDQLAWERIRDRRGRISRFVMLPSETIRPAVSDIEHMDPAQIREQVSYLQIYENTVISEFGVDDLAWCIMNPRSDLRSNGFGLAPTEQMIQLVTAWLYGFSHNQHFFQNGSAIKGLLNIKGSIPDRQLRAFRRMWYTMISGTQNAWRTPILNSEDIQWVSMHASNRDMEFSAWMDWLTKIVCSIYGIDPIEINFIFNSGKGGALNQSRPRADEVVESKDKGLVPLADHLVDSLNKFLVWEICPDLEFTFAGLDAKAEEKERARRKDECSTYKFVDEVRAERDLPPLPNGTGQVILNTVWLQNKQGAMQQQGGGDPDATAALGPGEEQPEDPYDLDQGQDDDWDDDGDDADRDDTVPQQQKQDDKLAASFISKVTDRLRKARHAITFEE